jgi:hypothetical protein
MSLVLHRLAGSRVVRCLVFKFGVEHGTDNPIIVDIRIQTMRPISAPSVP